MAETRRPIHLGIVIGLSTGVYALSLAGVTGLQSGQNAQLAADRGPAADVATRLEAANADLEARLAAAQSAFDASASTYSSVTDDLASYEGRLKALGETIGGLVKGASVSVPTGGSLPRVSSGGSVAKPPVHTTTSASGH
jgi:hypothetical protein